ncbi:TonB-dependent receptor plug domain-containing protein [Rhodanobacter koreensis]
MKLEVTKLSAAVRLAFSLGAVIAVGASGTAFAQDTSNQSTTSNPPPDQHKAKSLQTVVVTGSLVRRVDLETSNPVVTIDRAQIEATGKMTLGDLVQDLPAMTGGNTNPQLNNGGGTGASTINLRGLGNKRTLILVDGQRVIDAIGTYISTEGTSPDVNAIPAAMIERIEVLTDGASATYGSDAIGGVVNFILKKDYQGAQFTANVGESDHNDGDQSGYSFTFGQTSDKGSIMGGIEYNKQDGVEASSRSFSKNAVSIYGTNGTGPSAPQPATANIGGSSSSPYGHIQITGTPVQPLFGCSFVALNPGGNSQLVNTSNYHCYQNNGANSDKYNYAAINLILTPQERTNAFVMGTYRLSDNVSAYMNAYYNKTSSDFQLAPGIYGDNPYVAGNAIIDVNNYFNHFGATFSSAGPTINSRLSSLGNRVATFGANTEQVNVGLKGSFSLFDQDWNWDVGLDYGHSGAVTTTLNLPDGGKLYTGPSYMSATGLACGTAAAPTACPAGITSTALEFNPFDLYAPGSIAALKAAASPAITNQYASLKEWHAGINGGVLNLPAGTVQLAAGADYRQENVNSYVDPLLNFDPVAGTCVLGSQCVSATQGGYNVKELYAEAFIPVLSELPLVKSLNVTIGDRYSRYNDGYGSTNDFKFAVEYKPIDDLLLRGTMAQVFRAPNLAEEYNGAAADAPKLSNDPCTGYTGAPVNPACVNVPTNGTFINQAVAANNQITGILSGARFAGIQLKPEQGKSFDFGAIYSPSWAPGLSTTVDFWHVYLNNTITTVNAQSVLNVCAAGNLAFCPLIHRNPVVGPNQGQILTIGEPTANLGTLNTGGVDLSLAYKLPQFSFGQFMAGINATYLKYYNLQTAPGTASNTTYTDAGHFLPFGSPQEAACPGIGTCLFPRWRAQGFVNWQLGNWSASWRMRYIGRFQMGSKNPSQDVLPDGTCYYQGKPNPAGGVYRCNITGAVYKYGATVYNDLSFGYNIEPLNTRIDFGVNNVFDKQPPMLYANNTLNANTDPSDFDLMGRYFWARVTVKF